MWCFQLSVLAVVSTRRCLQLSVLAVVSTRRCLQFSVLNVVFCHVFAMWCSATFSPCVFLHTCVIQGPCVWHPLLHRSWQLGLGTCGCCTPLRIFPLVGRSSAWRCLTTAFGGASKGQYLKRCVVMGR